MTEPQNLFAGLPDRPAEEHVTPLFASPHLRIERIVSRGHASPPDVWYDQGDAEWVMVVSGSAGLQFEGDALPRVLRAGDYVQIPAHVRHRVAWTADDQPTIWLAVHHR